MTQKQKLRIAVRGLDAIYSLMNEWLEDHADLDAGGLVGDAFSGVVKTREVLIQQRQDAKPTSQVEAMLEQFSPEIILQVADVLRATRRSGA